MYFIVPTYLLFICSLISIYYTYIFSKFYRCDLKTLFMFTIYYPIYEEIIHREIIFHYTQYRFNLTKIENQTINALLFSIFHLQMIKHYGKQYTHLVLFQCFICYFLGLYIVQCESFFTGTLVHIIFNCIACIPVYIYKKRYLKIVY